MSKPKPPFLVRFSDGEVCCHDSLADALINVDANPTGTVYERLGHSTARKIDVQAMHEWAARFAPGATVDTERREVRFHSSEALRRALPFESPLHPGEMRRIDLGEFVVIAEEPADNPDVPF